MEALVVLTTVASVADGERLGRELVERRLAACVHIVSSLRSIYRWKGEIRNDAEVLLAIKTTAASYAQVEATILEIHGYDTPEVIALGIDRGSPAYLDWLFGEVGPH